MIPSYDDRDDEFLVAACDAMQASPGEEALATLGWWELLPHLDDPDARAAVFGVFRAQGRHLAGSVALSGIVVQPYLEGTAIAPGAVVGAIPRTSSRRGQTWLVVGDPAGRPILFADDEQAFLVEADALELVPVDVPGGLPAYEVRADLERRQALSDHGHASARRRSLQLGRLAAATEIHGAVERAVDLAADHARDREQFGAPIGTFQAVRHLLAWARTDCVALGSTLRMALVTLDDPPVRFDEATKALAGRNGRRACQRSLQVLGAIGFTAEHSFHHYQSRVLLLDALLGTSAELTQDLGAWLRTTGDDPGYAARFVRQAS